MSPDLHPADSQEDHLTSTDVRTLNPARITLVGGLCVALASTALLIAGCSGPATPVSPSPNGSGYLNRDVVANLPVSQHAAAHDDKGYIDGWFNGTDVRLHYTKSYFCAEPPASGAESGCVIGADAEVPPRPGQMRKIYAIAAVGFRPD